MEEDRLTVVITAL